MPRVRPKAGSEWSRNASPQHIHEAISWSRRDFLRGASASAGAAALSAFSPLRAMAVRKGQKAVVVTFGGGTRDEETFMPGGRRISPTWSVSLSPRARFLPR